MDYKELYADLSKTDRNIDRLLNDDKRKFFLSKKVQELYKSAEKYVHLMYLIEQNKIKVINDRLTITSTGEETNLIDLDSFIENIN